MALVLGRDIQFGDEDGSRAQRRDSGLFLVGGGEIGLFQDRLLLELLQGLPAVRGDARVPGHAGLPGALESLPEESGEAPGQPKPELGVSSLASGRHAQEQPVFDRAKADIDLVQAGHGFFPGQEGDEAEYRINRTGCQSWVPVEEGCNT